LPAGYGAAPEKAGHWHSMPTGYEVRSGIECAINRLRQHRAVSARCDKLTVRCLATVHGAININWLRDLPNTA
jgi:hypothetical protein